MGDSEDKDCKVCIKLLIKAVASSSLVGIFDKTVAVTKILS